jgi:hypothetical protein
MTLSSLVFFLDEATNKILLIARQSATDLKQMAYNYQLLFAQKSLSISHIVTPSIYQEK